MRCFFNIVRSSHSWPTFYPPGSFRKIWKIITLNKIFVSGKCWSFEAIQPTYMLFQLHSQFKALDNVKRECFLKNLFVK